MNIWDKFNEKVLPGKDSFYSNLTLENISEMIVLMQTTYSKNLILIIWVNTMTCYIRCYLRIYSKILDDLV